MTGHKAHIRPAVALIFLSLLGGLFAHPAGAQSTEDKLDAVRARIGQLRADATRATQRHQEAWADLVTTRDEIGETRAAMAEAETRLGRLEVRLEDVARTAYRMGAIGAVDLLLTSESFSEFSDRVVFLDQMAEDDASIITRVTVISEELRRRRADLARLEAELQRLEAELERAESVLYGKLEEARSLEERYEDQLAAERAAAARQAASTPTGGGGGGSGSGSIPTVSGGALQACPAPGTSFVDSFGAPRSGGRTHAGVDMMGSYGMPIYAAQSGSVSHSSSSLGGLQAYVYAGNGDYTFYAHLQGYSGASGQVSAGTLIGYMGDTGNASSPHLHFEYHPGGALTNPYPHVVAVC
jgi:peptidoglycan LD-endopeptidase LytH